MDLTKKRISKIISNTNQTRKKIDIHRKKKNHRKYKHSMRHKRNVNLKKKSLKFRKRNVKKYRHNYLGHDADEYNSGWGGTKIGSEFTNGSDAGVLGKSGGPPQASGDVNRFGQGDERETTASDAKALALGSPQNGPPQLRDNGRENPVPGPLDTALQNGAASRIGQGDETVQEVDGELDAVSESGDVPEGDKDTQKEDDTRSASLLYDVSGKDAVQTGPSQIILPAAVPNQVAIGDGDEKTTFDDTKKPSRFGNPFKRKTESQKLNSEYEDVIKTANSLEKETIKYKNKIDKLLTEYKGLQRDIKAFDSETFTDYKDSKAYKDMNKNYNNKKNELFTAIDELRSLTIDWTLIVNNLELITEKQKLYNSNPTQSGGIDDVYMSEQIDDEDTIYGSDILNDEYDDLIGGQVGGPTDILKFDVTKSIGENKNQADDSKLKITSYIEEIGNREPDVKTYIDLNPKIKHIPIKLLDKIYKKIGIAKKTLSDMIPKRQTDVQSKAVTNTRDTSGVVVGDVTNTPVLQTTDNLKEEIKRLNKKLSALATNKHIIERDAYDTKTKLEKKIKELESKMKDNLKQKELIDTLMKKINELSTKQSMPVTIKQNLEQNDLIKELMAKINGLQGKIGSSEKTYSGLERENENVFSLMKTEDKGDYKLIKITVAIPKHLNVNTVSEGDDTWSQLNRLIGDVEQREKKAAPAAAAAAAEESAPAAAAEEAAPAAAAEESAPAAAAEEAAPAAAAEEAAPAPVEESAPAAAAEEAVPAAAENPR